MRGLMTRHGVDPRSFLDFVHEIDMTMLDPAPELDAALARLPGRKIIFTNADSALFHRNRHDRQLADAHHQRHGEDPGDQRGNRRIDFRLPNVRIGGFRIERRQDDIRAEKRDREDREHEKRPRNRDEIGAMLLEPKACLVPALAR